MSYPSSAYTFPWDITACYVIKENGDGTLTAWTRESGTYYNHNGYVGTANINHNRWTFNGTSWSGATNVVATSDGAYYRLPVLIEDAHYHGDIIRASTESKILPKPFINWGTYPLPSGVSNFFIDVFLNLGHRPRIVYGVSNMYVDTQNRLGDGINSYNTLKYRLWNGSGWGSETSFLFLQYSGTHIDYVIFNSHERTNNNGGTFPIIPFEEPSEEVENYNGVAEISQASTVVSVNSKQSKLVASVSQPSTVVTAYTKAESSEDYDLVAEVNQSSSVVANLSKQVSSIASVEQVSTIEAQNTKAINLASEVSQPSTVVAQANKLTYLVADISRLSSVSAENKKSTYLVAEINQGSTVYSTVSAEVPSYDYNLVASVEQSSDVGASLSKQSSLVGQVAQDESVVAQASKHIEVIASIEQGSTIYSFVTKEELEKTISASVEQSSSVVASVSKQSDISALVEQLSTIESVLQRISASRLTTIIRIAEKLQFKEIVLSENLGSKKTGSIQFDEPIRKVVDLD